MLMRFLANSRWAEGNAKPSFTSEIIEKGFLSKNEEIIKHVASTLYGGGADTVSVLTYQFFS